MYVSNSNRFGLRLSNSHNTTTNLQIYLVLKNRKKVNGLIQSWCPKLKWNIYRVSTVGLSEAPLLCDCDCPELRDTEDLRTDRGAWVQPLSNTSLPSLSLNIVSKSKLKCRKFSEINQRWERWEIMFIFSTKSRSSHITVYCPRMEYSAAPYIICVVLWL